MCDWRRGLRRGRKVGHRKRGIKECGGRGSEKRESAREHPKQEMKMKPERSRETRRSKRRRRIEEEKETVRTNEPDHPNWE